MKKTVNAHIVTIPPLPLSFAFLTSSTAVRRSRSKSSITFTVRRVQAICNAGGDWRAFTAATAFRTSACQYGIVHARAGPPAHWRDKALDSQCQPSLSIRSPTS